MTIQSFNGVHIIKKDLPNSMMEITVTVAGDEMNGYFEQAAANLSQNIKISGFRSGKAPIDTVEKKVGSQELFNEAAGIAVRRTLPKVLMENKIDSLGIPDIKILKIAKGNDFEYKAEIAVLMSYMPEQLTEEKIRELAKDAVAKSGAKGEKETCPPERRIGKVMAILMPQIKGQSDGALVNKIVRELLA